MLRELYIVADQNLYNGEHLDVIIPHFSYHGLVNYISDISATQFGRAIDEEDDWLVQGANGPDMDYKIYSEYGGYYDISTCHENTDYDTKLEIFYMDGTTTWWNYNDDDWDCIINDLSSTIFEAYLDPGYYFLVADGWGGLTGNFGLNIIEW